MLKEFASRLRKNVRGSISPAATAARSLSSSCRTPRHIAEKVAERIRAEIEASGFAIRDDGTTIDVTASVGVSTLNRPHDPVQALIKRADLAPTRRREAAATGWSRRLTRSRGLSATAASPPRRKFTLFHVIRSRGLRNG
ncbi:MAG: diguanylate cyclase [Brucellaceae bacterium]|nr:diguanylate cyclase [Brucellaceae bacterium]